MFGLGPKNALAALAALCLALPANTASAHRSSCSLLTMVGGKVVYAAEPFTNMAAPKTVAKSR